jgi:hypothetical protein
MVRRTFLVHPRAVDQGVHTSRVSTVSQRLGDEVESQKSRHSREGGNPGAAEISHSAAWISAFAGMTRTKQKDVCVP